ncbi:unnamed protein product [Linum tenue]|uniref:Uncharacterized protein n=1 Tax=Linum tenue TaxID=586396 RepID=A0AAV0HME1_9ROSI|nr:unnamed protein product [Linum tenue]
MDSDTVLTYPCSFAKYIYIFTLPVTCGVGMVVPSMTQIHPREGIENKEEKTDGRLINVRVNDDGEVGLMSSKLANPDPHDFEPTEEQLLLPWPLPLLPISCP